MKKFDSPNYTQTPNDLFDNLLSLKGEEKIGEAELRVTLILIRQTFGYHRTKKRMSIRKLAKASGLSASNAWSGTEAAVKRGTFTKTNDGGVTIWELQVIEPEIESVPVAGTVNTESVPVAGTPSIKEKIVKEKPLGDTPTRPVATQFQTTGEKKKRQPNKLFDAIAKTCQVDPATAGSQIAKVAKVLSSANPPYTEADVEAYRKQWWEWKDRKVAPTVWQLQERIGVVRSSTKPNAKQTGGWNLKGIGR